MSSRSGWDGDLPPRIRRPPKDERARDLDDWDEWDEDDPEPTDVWAEDEGTEDDEDSEE